MNRIFAALSIVILSTSAFAGPSCNVPKEKWTDQDKFKAGNKVEIYFDPQTGAELERK